MKYRFSISLLLVCLFLGSCVSRHKNIVYSKEHDLRLDVYSPRKVDKPIPVLVFIHGGNWVRGKKSIYKFFGKGFAKKGVVTVIINYRLSPTATYDSLTTNAAASVKWVKQNINNYGGDTTNIFVSGHSAGAHLAALIATDDSYFKKQGIKNPIRGTILIDAFGLDMYSYLTNAKTDYSHRYFPLFSQDPEIWKKGSPVFHFHKGMPPFLMFVGTKTVPTIWDGTTEFLKALQPYQPGAPLVIVKGKRHVGMIFQFMNKRNKRYKDILNFIKQESR